MSQRQISWDGVARAVRTAAGATALLAAAAVAAGAQTGLAPIKPGLWETQLNMTPTMQLPPEMQQRLAAMPPEQQERMKAMMGGTQAISNTSKSCVASQTTVDKLMDQAQDKAGMKCSFSNRKETESSISFDVSCTSPQGTMAGHSDIHMQDSDHVTGTMHMTGSFSARSGQPIGMDITTKMDAHYLGADCGMVKPGGSE